MKFDGPKVRTLRQKAKMPSLELAKGICSDLMLFQIENGFANPSEEVMGQIAERLGVRIEDLHAE